MLLGFVEGDEARRLGSVTARQRRQSGDRLLRPVPSGRGCRIRRATPNSTGSGSNSERRLLWHPVRPVGLDQVRVPQALREAVGLIRWAGTETAATWCGYMDGGGALGRRAAAEVLALLS